MVMFYVDGILSLLYSYAIEHSKIFTISESGIFYKSYLKMPTQSIFKTPTHSKA